MRGAGSLWHKRHHSNSSEQSSTWKWTTLLVFLSHRPPGEEILTLWHIWLIARNRFKFPKIVRQSNYSRWSQAARPESFCPNIGRLVVMRPVMTYSHVKTIRSLDWLSVQCWNIHEILGFSVCFKINSWVLDLSNPVSCFQQKYFHLFLYISVLSPLNLKKVVSSELFYYYSTQALLMPVRNGRLEK